MGILKSLFGGTSSIEAPQSSRNASIGRLLLPRYKPFIRDRKSAEKAALSVLWHGKNQFIEAADGDIIRASDSDIPLPDRLRSFSDRLYTDNGMTVSHDVIGLTYELTRAIDDQVVQIETIYSIAEAIVERYDL